MGSYSVITVKMYTMDNKNCLFSYCWAEAKVFLGEWPCEICVNIFHKQMECISQGYEYKKKYTIVSHTGIADNAKVQRKT